MNGNSASLLRSLGAADLRNLRRDPLLVWMVIFPPALALLFRQGVPWLRELLLHHWELELHPYYPLIMSFFLLTAPVVAGLITGFLLLDERDEGVLSAIAVTPVPWSRWLAYRLAIPSALGSLMTIASYPMVGLVPLYLVDLLAIAAVASLLAPITALFLAAFAENKVSGFAMVKILNTVNMIPIVAWFFDPPLQWIGGVIPSYWPMKMLWLASSERPYALHGLAGVVVGIVALALLGSKFRSRLSR